MVDFAAARLNMVESQLRTNKVTDLRLLAAFETVPRELFVPEPLRGIAYIDEDVALGGGRFVMEPRVLARLLQAAQPGPEDVALDLGCGSGYATAILSRLVATVVALEDDAALAAAANRTLEKLEIDNAVVVEGRLTEGRAGPGPRDADAARRRGNLEPDPLRRRAAGAARVRGRARLRVLIPRDPWSYATTAIAARGSQPGRAGRDLAARPA